MDNLTLIRMASEGITKQDIMAIRPILRTWIGGGWTDGPQLARLLAKHEQTLAKFKPTKPVKLWRNERIPGPGGFTGPALNNHGAEDQYTRPTAWSAEKMAAETYAISAGRRLVTALVPPEDIYVSVPMVDYWCRQLGLKPIDEHGQSEMIVKPNPSFLAQIRRPVARQDEQSLRQELETAMLAAYLPELAKAQQAGKKVISEADLRERIAGAAKDTHIEDLPEKIREWQGRKVASAFCYGVTAAFTFKPKRDWRDYVLVLLDVDKVEASYSQDKGFYVGPQGVGGIGKRYERFLQWLEENPDTPIDPPFVGLTPSGTIMFGDGRHRWAVLRDMGEKRIPAMVAREDEKVMREKFGAPSAKAARAEQWPTESFKQWFAGSKIVDAGGNPLPVYHGSTRGGITQSTVQSSFFTPDKAVATTYSKDDYLGGKGSNPVVQAFYLRILNPLEVDAGGEPWMQIPFEGGVYTTNDLAALAKRRGHDGLIIRNVEDNVNDEELPPSDVIVTLGGRAQIKSAENNVGTFDPQDHSVTAATRAYHGTNRAFDRFDLDAAGSGRGAEGERALFFSLTPETANHSAEVMGADGGGAQVYPVYLTMNNPYVSPLRYYNSEEMAAEIQKAKAGGHDSITFPKLESEGESGTVAVFSPDQVATAIGKTASKTLYHGTTVTRAKKIMAEGLEPQVGSLVQQAYGDEADYDFEPLAFAAEKQDINRGVYSAMLHAIAAEGHDTTNREQAIRNYGAVVVLKDGEDQMEHRGRDDEFDYTDHPLQVEGGDYYSREGVVPDYVITGPALVRFFKRNGGDFLHRGLNPRKVNALIGMVKRAHPSVPVEAIVEKVWSLSPQEFSKSWTYYSALPTSKAASYEQETQVIKDNADKARHPHKFLAGDWTFPNGHPRCLICGDEETLDGQCPGRKTAAKAEVGVNINDSEQPWTTMILQGRKTVETRNSDSLRPHVGDRVGIVRTGVGPATLVGYCVIGEPKVYRTNEELRADHEANQIPAGPAWDLQPGQVKFGYPLTNVEAVQPRPLTTQGRVFRRLATQVPRVVYHGQQTEDTPRRQNGILWATTDQHMALAYANTYWRKGVPTLWALGLNPAAKLVALWDLDNPVIREIKEQVAAERKMQFGVGISDSAWDSYADFSILETKRWVVDALKKARVDAVWVHDTAHMGGGERQDSLAILADRAISTVTKVTPKVPQEEKRLA